VVITKSNTNITFSCYGKAPLSLNILLGDSLSVATGPDTVYITEQWNEEKAGSDSTTLGKTLVLDWSTTTPYDVSYIEGSFSFVFDGVHYLTYKH
jgi:hypothetical protein